MVENKWVSTSTLNIIINALKFYYGEILGKKFIYEVKRPRKDKKLPVILNKDEVIKILQALSNTKHKAIFATHLLESGVNLRYIQEILGHKSSKTTEIYTHVSKASIARIKNPLDSIMEERG